MRTVYRDGMNLLIRWALGACALWVTIRLNVGVSIVSEGVVPLVFAAAILGLVNALVRPIMIVLTLPLTVLSFGSFLLIVNGVSLGVVAALTPLELSGFGGAVLGALVLTVVNAVLQRLVRDDPRVRR